MGWVKKMDHVSSAACEITRGNRERNRHTRNSIYTWQSNSLLWGSWKWKQVSQSLHTWYSKPSWTWPWATCCSWPCFEQGGWMRWSPEVSYNFLILWRLEFKFWSLLRVSILSETILTKLNIFYQLINIAFSWSRRFPGEKNTRRVTMGFPLNCYAELHLLMYNIWHNV